MTGGVICGMINLLGGHLAALFLLQREKYKIKE